MGTQLQPGEIRKFWRWLVVMAQGCPQTLPLKMSPWQIACVYLTTILKI